MASANAYILDYKEYPIEIIRKNNKNTYLRVKDGKIIVTTNYLTSLTTINKLIKNNTTFIDKALNKNNQKKDNKSLNKYLSKYIYNIYEERINYYYSLFEENIPIPNLKIRKMTSRWGVCNIKNHNVTLNLELSKYNIECLNYVIVHELSHFIHPNHSKEFWLLVGKYYPNYKNIRKYLRNNT